MIKAAECTGMRTWLGLWCREPMLRRAETSPAGRAAAVKSTAMKSAGAIEVVAIDENFAVGYVAVVVEKNAVMMPIITPVVPAPAMGHIQARKQPQGRPVRSQWFAPACSPFPAMCCLSSPPSLRAHALPEQR